MSSTLAPACPDSLSQHALVTAQNRLQQQLPTTTAQDIIRTFLSTRFADQSGWFCLGYINGDPLIQSMVQEWYTWPQQERAVIDRYSTLAERGCNLYLAPCLFSERKRSYPTALPSRWLWIDDAAIDGAELIESSEGNFQSWLLCDQPLSAKERSSLQRAIRDHAAGADTCSANGIPMARLPGGWNRKRHCFWHVRIVQTAPMVFSSDELRQRYSITEQLSMDDGEQATDDWPTDLPDGAILAQSARFTALLRTNEQLRKVSAGEAIPIRMKNGRTDDSPSNQRAIFVYQLIRAHYPDNEICALALHFTEKLNEKKELHHFKKDILKLLYAYKPTVYTPEPTRSRQPIPEALPPSHAGRPPDLTADELLAFYHEHADCGYRGIILDWTRSETAQALGVSYDTIQRREKDLIAQGHIRRIVSNDRQSSFVVLSVHTWDVYAECNTEHSVAAEQPVNPQCEEHACAEITHGPRPAGTDGHAPASTTAVPVAPAADGSRQVGEGGIVLFPAAYSAQMTHLDEVELISGPAGALVYPGGAAYVPGGAEEWYDRLISLGHEQKSCKPAFQEAPGAAEQMHAIGDDLSIRELRTDDRGPMTDHGSSMTGQAVPVEPELPRKRRRGNRASVDPGRLRSRIIAAERKAEKLKATGKARDRAQANVISRCIEPLKRQLAVLCASVPSANEKGGGED